MRLAALKLSRLLRNTKFSIKPEIYYYSNNLMREATRIVRYVLLGAGWAVLAAGFASAQPNGLKPGVRSVTIPISIFTKSLRRSRRMNWSRPNA
jgi:hypothetical protein